MSERCLIENICIDYALTQIIKQQTASMCTVQTCHVLQQLLLLHKGRCLDQHQPQPAADATAGEIPTVSAAVAAAILCWWMLRPELLPELCGRSGKLVYAMAAIHCCPQVEHLQ